MPKKRTRQTMPLRSKRAIARTPAVAEPGKTRTVVTIEATDTNEADLIRAGLSNPEARAVVKIVGALVKLPTADTRRRAIAAAAGFFAHSDE